MWEKGLKVIVENPELIGKLLEQLGSMPNMERIKTQVIGDKRILFPLTKKQKDIFEMFEIEKPG